MSGLSVTLNPAYWASDSSDSDDDDMDVSQHLKQAIKTAKAVKDTFNLYPWADTPWEIKSDEIANRRFTWLQNQDGYPLTREIDTFYGTPHRPFDLLFIFYHVKHDKSFDEKKFRDGIGEIRRLHADLESCTIL